MLTGYVLEEIGTPIADSTEEYRRHIEEEKIAAAAATAAAAGVTTSEDAVDMTTTKKVSKNNIFYTIDIETNVDFVIKKTTTRSEEFLCILLGKGQYYIKGRNGELYDLTKEEKPETVIKQFLYKLKEPINLNNNIWIANIENSAECINRIVKVMQDSVIQELCRKNLISIRGIMVGSDNYWMRGDITALLVMYTMDKNIFMRATKCYKTPFEAALHFNKYSIGMLSENIFCLYYAIKERFGLNNAYNFIDKCVENERMICCYKDRNTFNDLIHLFCGDNLEYQAYNYTNKIYGTYKVNTGYSKYSSKWTNKPADIQFEYKAFERFFFGPLLKEGLAINYWVDYLEMQRQLGEIKDKYPKSLRTAHDTMVYKFNTIKTACDSEAFNKKVKEYEWMEYEDTVTDYCIVTPKFPIDLADEGAALGHCIKSYIPKVTGGESTICFLRKKRQIDSPLVTIEVINNTPSKICGAFHRRCTPAEEAVIKRWAKKKKMGAPIFDAFG